MDKIEEEDYDYSICIFKLRNNNTDIIAYVASINSEDDEDDIEIDDDDSVFMVKNPMTFSLDENSEVSIKPFLPISFIEKNTCIIHAMDILCFMHPCKKFAVIYAKLADKFDKEFEKKNKVPKQKVVKKEQTVSSSNVVNLMELKKKPKV